MVVAVAVVVVGGGERPTLPWAMSATVYSEMIAREKSATVSTSFSIRVRKGLHCG